MRPPRARCVWLVFLSACHPEPWAPQAPASCGAGEILDGEECVPEACGAAPWGAVPVDAGTVFVDGAAAAGGDGSEATPLNAIQAGVDLAASRDGALVAVAAGTYFENVSMGDGYRDIGVEGRCKDLVVMDGSADRDLPTLAIIGVHKRPEVVFRGLTLIGGGSGGLWAEQATVVMTDTEVRGNTLAGVVALSGADVSLDTVAILDTVADRGDFGRGVDVESGATFTAKGCTIQGNTDAGVAAFGVGTVVELEDTEVRNTVPLANADVAAGIHVEDGAAFTATGCGILGNAGIGVFALGAGTSVTLEDTDVLDTAPLPDGTFGRGIDATDGPALTVTRCIVQGNAEFGLIAYGAGTSVQIADTEILDTAPTPAGTLGTGLQVAYGAVLTGSGCTLSGNAGVGAYAFGAGTSVTLEGTWILDTQPRPDGSDGVGLEVGDGAALAATGCTFQGNTSGMLIGEVGTSVDLVGCAILDTIPRPDGSGGHGLEVGDGASLKATGCSVERSTEVGVLAHSVGTTLELIDTDVGETRRGRESGLATGVVAQEDAWVRLSGGHIQGAEGLGLYAGAGGVAELDGVQLNDNQFAAVMVGDGAVTLAGCGISGTLPDTEWGGGFGIYALNDRGAPTLTLLDSTVGPHAYAAVWIDGPGSYDIERNALSGSSGVPSGTATLHGNAVFAERGVAPWNGTTGLYLSGNSFAAAPEISVLLDGASATLDDNSWSGNGTDLRVQRCEEANPIADAELVGIPLVVVCPGSNVLTAYDLVLTSLYLPTAGTAE